MLLDLREWWASIDNTYRAGICLLVSLLLMWAATRHSNELDRQFFLTGMAALALLGVWRHVVRSLRHPSIVLGARLSDAAY